MTKQRGGWFLIVALHLPAWAGCEVLLVPSGVDGPGGAGPSSSDPNGNGPGTDPGDSFAEATTLALDGDGRATVSALLATSDDLDLYDLGSLSGGDRLIVDVTAQASALDPVAAVFDDQMRLVGLNDDRDFRNNQLDPRLEIIVRHDANPTFVGVSAFSGNGAYRLSVQVVSDGEVPAPVSQTVLLDFDGGSIVLLDGAEKSVPVFDAASIDAALAGETAALKQAIVAAVASDFADFDMTVLNTDDDPVPTDGVFSRVLFGGFSADVFGEAQGVDLYNADAGDEAIVYTEGFSREALGGRRRPERFARDRGCMAAPCRLAQARLRALLQSGGLGTGDVGLAIGNVAAHEIGHLLGLNHVADPRFLMDTTGAANTLLADQVFGLAPLDDSIFPVGWQDSALLLRETLGPEQN